MLKHFKLQDSFEQYVVCYKCHSVYKKNRCIEKSGTQVKSKFCSFRTHQNSTNKCGTLLLKTVKLLNGKKHLYPFKVYCYNSIKSSLKHFLMRPGFSHSCDHWRSIVNSPVMLKDIYSGKIWNKFQYYNGEPLLASSHTYALMLNIDWFQPYALLEYSVGAIYLAIMNLPYEQRFKRENIILVGTIPGPTEPHRDINQYLRPLVYELLELLDGIPMKIYGEQELQVVKAILIGVSCDMPAGRKACGFLAHSASLGCNKCLKTFPGSVGSKDYSGFDRDRWIKRTNEEHRLNVHRIQQAKTKTERDRLESRYGCRYSVLLQLPYFDPTRMLLIDPMHNLCLGSAKHLTKLWINNDPAIITKSELKSIQALVDEMHVPADLGRIPRKIEIGSGFSGFTADQFKNWVLYYSIPSLFRVLNSEQLECWRSYVLACRLLCQRSISLSQLTLADAFLVQFCKRFELVYGKKHVTPNMHTHCHLKDVLLDYGPVYGFWLFSFERMNGVLEHQPTNHQHVETQLMRRFNHDNAAYATENPTDFHDELSEFCTLRQNLVGSLLPTKSHADRLYEFSNVFTVNVFEDHEATNLKGLLAKLNTTSLDKINVNMTYKKYKYLTIKDIKINSSTTKNFSVAMATWKSDVLGEILSVSAVNPIDIYQRPILINGFLKATFFIDGQIQSQYLVSAKWFQSHPSRFIVGKPAQIWCKNLFERGGIHSFIPLGFLICRCVYTTIKVDRESVLCIVPLVEEFNHEISC